MPPPERSKQLPEVQLLAAICDVDDLVRVPGFEPVPQGSQIGAGVIETAIALLNDKRIGHPLTLFVNEEGVVLRRAGAVGEDGTGAAALGGKAAAHQVIHNRLEARMVKALAQGVVEFHAQPAIDGFKLGL